MDETNLKLRESWVYLYRAVDREGHTVDVAAPTHLILLRSRHNPPSLVFATGTDGVNT
jgi:transposase-like protein